MQIDCDLPEKRETLDIRLKTGLTLDVVCGRLLLFWRWVERHFESPKLDGATMQMLIEVAQGDEKFWNSVAEVGWVIFENDGISVPRWKKRFSKSAKRRKLGARRASRCRNARVTHQRYERNARALPKEEKRREENNNPLPLIPEPLNTVQFAQAWSDWIAHRAEIKKPLRPTQAAKQLKLLERKGVVAAVAMIEHTIEKGWQGLRDPDGVAVGPEPLRMPTDEEFNAMASQPPGGPR